jgi:adenosine deaminase CECR1
MQCFFHAGETHDQEISNIHDSVLLNSKRIGHGFQLTLFPYLVKEVKERDICVEICPLSNMVLGYTLDLRMHPCRFLLSQGVQASISSDDPGFFDYRGVTLDYVYVTLAWELDIADLKKLSLNGIKYSSVSSDVKKHLNEEVFPNKWKAWVEWLNKLELNETMPVRPKE